MINSSKHSALHRLSRLPIAGAAMMLLLGPIASAQTFPATAPSTAPAETPVAAPTPELIAASTLPGGTSTTAPIPAARFIFNFHDASIDTVLEHLSEVAGFIVVKDMPVDGRITVYSKQAVTPSEAVAMLDSVLKVSGYTAIQTGRVLRITTRDKAKKANIPVFFGAKPEDIPATDALITQVIPLQAVDAVKLKADLAPLIGPDADVSSNASSNSIMITDTSANVRRVVEIIAALDQHQSTANDIRVVTLKYADATSAAKLLTDILAPPPQSTGGNVPAQIARAMRFMGRGGGQDAAADEGHGGRLVASADVRTNTVVLAGPADTVKVAESILKELDADQTEIVSFFIYNLKNGQASDLQGVLNTLFGASTGGTSNSNSINNGFGSNGATNALTRTNGSSFGSAGGSGSSSSGININNGAQQQQQRPASGGGAAGVPAGVATAAQQLAGQVYVVANVDTNSLMVVTTKKFEKRVRDILDELDRPIAQVLIKCLIAEVTHNNSTNLGLQYSVLTQGQTGKGYTFGPNFGLPAGLSPTTTGLVGAVVGGDFTMALQALASTDKLDVLSRPYILATDNQLASIIVGQEVPLITDVRYTDTGQQINTVQYQQIGIIVNVTPHINPEGLVIMDVAPQVSQLDAQSVTISTGVTAPLIDTRAAQTRVGIRDGETIVIGGLMQDQNTTTISKVPLLGDIPGLGALFRQSNVTKTKTELLIFLTPHVASRPEYLQKMSQDEMRGTLLTPSAVQPGALEAHLKGMTLGTTRPATQPLLLPYQLPLPRDAGVLPIASPSLPGTNGQTPTTLPTTLPTEKPNGS